MSPRGTPVSWSQFQSETGSSFEHMREEPLCKRQKVLSEGDSPTSDLSSDSCGMEVEMENTESVHLHQMKARLGRCLPNVLR